LTMIEISLDPIMLKIGSLELGWYGFFIGLGVLALLAWCMYIVRKERPVFTVENLLTVTIITIPAAIVGARLFHIIDYWDYYWQNPSLIWGFEGLAIWGALVFGILAILVYCTIVKVNFFKAMDVAVPGIFLAQSIGRFGCLSTGCCFGNPTSLPFGILYTNPHSHGFSESIALPEGMSLLPTQMFESLFMLAMFFLFALVLRKRGWPAGILLLVYAAVYAVWRLILGFMRTNEAVWLGLSQAQLVSVLLIILVIPLGYYLIRRHQNNMPVDV